MLFGQLAVLQRPLPPVDCYSDGTALAKYVRNVREMRGACPLTVY